MRLESGIQNTRHRYIRILAKTKTKLLWRFSSMCSGTFVTNLNCRQTLSLVTKAVYVMQCDQDQRLFRFGLIGAGGRLKSPPLPSGNSALKRLGQCPSTWRHGNGKAPTSWKYLLLYWVQGATRNQIRCFEKCLRMGLSPYTPYNNLGTVKRFKDGLKQLAKPKDAFLSASAFAIKMKARKSLVNCKCCVGTTTAQDMIQQQDIATLG